MARAGARVAGWWQSSLRVRVIVSTMVLGTVLTTLIGTLLYQRVANGLVDQAVANAEADAASQVQLAQEQLDTTDRRDDGGLSEAAYEIINQMAPGAQRDQRLAVLTRSLDNERDARITSVTLGGIGTSVVPLPLREALSQDPNLQQVFVTRLQASDRADQAPVVMVGSRVQIPRAGPHDLVLIYPMDREQEILDLIREWFLVGGVLLLLLVGGVAWLATRLVTEPVGQAAAVSQDLARGELDERLPVRGTDELAQLAMSFNTMADGLQRQIQQLEQLSQVQQRFVSDVSHELRTPLTTIRMAGEMLHLSRADFAPPVARSAELLHGELDRFEELLEELLEISRYDSGTTVIEAVPGDLLALTHEVLATVAPLVQRSGSVVRVRCDQSGMPVQMDARRIARVLRNLVVNALEHGEGKPIDIRLRRCGDAVVLCVRDHGVGLAPEEFERVFERFWRADAARTRTTGGTGLGLAIAREDAAAHGGGLHATGRLGQGACFRLVLPVTQNLTSGEALEVPCAEQWETPRSGSGRVTAGQRGAPRR
ncbi:MAG: HAMP domain-containing histidine kinase [Actinobacteria bacterium]|nr:HAMP domain-containing histidine kinase [Actinomycetota bacterium]